MSNKKSGRPMGVTGQAKVLDEKELKQVLKFIEIGNHSKRNSAIVIISHYLGLRAKEISSLKIGDVYENGSIKKVLRLIAAYTKGSKHRDLSLENKMVIKSLKEYIQERQEEDGITFSEHAPLFRSQYAGIDLNSIRQIAGHSSISTTQRYIENDPNRMADILRGI